MISLTKKERRLWRNGGKKRVKFTLPIYIYFEKMLCAKVCIIILVGKTGRADE